MSSQSQCQFDSSSSSSARTCRMRGSCLHSAWQLFQGGFLRRALPPAVPSLPPFLARSFLPSNAEHDVVTTTVNIYNLARACDDDAAAAMCPEPMMTDREGIMH